MTRHRPEIPRLGVGAALIVIVLMVATAAAWLTTTRRDPLVATSPPEPIAGHVPAFRHVYLIVMENHAYDDVIADEDAPTINDLASRGALATDYHAVGRPSEPNYLGLVSGSTQGVTDDGVYDLGAPTLADQLEAGNLSWAVSAENLPGPCFTGQTAAGGADGDGTYARKHEPFISFTSVSGNPDRCRAHLHDLAAFDPAAAAFQLIVPNLCHDGHDCSLRVADQWLAGFLPRITDSAAFADRGVIFLTFDEGNSTSDQVPMIADGFGVQAGTRSADPRTHYAWLRTLEDAWGLPCLGASCTSGNLYGLFLAPAASLRA